MDSIDVEGGDEASARDGTGASGPRGGVGEWVLVNGDRLHLTAGGSAAVLLLFTLLYQFDIVAFTNQNSITRMASGMIAGSFSLVTLVVSVNQLILSQEFAPAGKYRDRLEGVMSFRRDVEDATGVSATPRDPSRILELIVETTRERSTTLTESVADSADDEYRRAVAEYARDVAEGADRIERSLEGGNGDVFEVLAAAVSFENGRRLHAARRLRNEYASSEDERDAFDGLVEILKLFESGQHYFKTVYLQRELTRFSQLTIYAGVPAVVTAVLIIFLYGETGGMTLPATYFPNLIILLSTVVLVPVVLLTSFVLRITTLTRRTAAIGPMTLRTESDAE